MHLLFWIIGATLFNSLLGLSGALSLLFSKPILEKTTKILVAFSAGVLLGGAFFHLLAEALITLPVNLVFGIAIAGFLLFFILEEYLHWHQCEECEIHPYSYLMIVGDVIHNLLDGLVIAGTFLVSIPVGIVTTFMVMGHELPQELGVFAILLHGGIKKQQAIWYSFAAQTSCILGGLIGFFLMNQAAVLASYILPLAAGGFIYIAAADLIPSIHHTEGLGKIAAFIWLCLGLGFMIAIKYFFNV